MYLKPALLLFFGLILFSCKKEGDNFRTAGDMEARIGGVNKKWSQNVWAAKNFDGSTSLYLEGASHDTMPVKEKLQVKITNNNAAFTKKTYSLGTGPYRITATFTRQTPNASGNGQYVTTTYSAITGSAANYDFFNFVITEIDSNSISGSFAGTLPLITDTARAKAIAISGGTFKAPIVRAPF